MNKTITGLSLFILVAISSVSNAQVVAGTGRISKSNNFLNWPDGEPTKKEKRAETAFRNNVSAHFGTFDPWVGAYYERLISAYWGFDAALGLIGGSIGTKVYFPRLSDGKISFYTGISEGVLLMVGPTHYIPVGVTYPVKKGFRISTAWGFKFIGIPVRRTSLVFR